MTSLTDSLSNAAADAQPHAPAARTLDGFALGL
ncbi:hypothetical protein BURMUCF2_0617, partial [Burkholderia multivorans CF2]